MGGIRGGICIEKWSWNFDLGTPIAIFGTPKTLKMGVFGYFGGKVIFGHFIYFGHFPIEIPIEAEKYYHHGKELSYRENKMCSETSEAMRTTWEHAQSDIKNFSQ